MENTQSKENKDSKIKAFIILCIFILIFLNYNLLKLLRLHGSQAKEEISMGQDLDLSVNLNFEDYILDESYMPIDHQKYLYNLCISRKLNYIKTLGLLKHESQFNPSAISHTDDYGYMQINKINHENLAKKLNTENNPLDPYINLNWGTYMLAKLYEGFSYQGLSGRELDESVWSAYNKGVAGFNQYGKALRYIERTDKEIDWLIEELKL